ncbi:unnamed protein product [Paramecium sonneborni]|uniref:Uncharacterized protein n=1 Tax=Paramecium sonneborni TaxID=65129 RepID=A0A8S1MX98_9CILI|nr:unnamed protein product [Paramecium sonneborni]
MNANQEFLCFEQNEEIMKGLAQSNKYTEIIEFCDRQIALIQVAQIVQQDSSEEPLDFCKVSSQSSGSFILAKIDSYVSKFQIESAYEFYFKKKIKTLRILEYYQEAIQCRQLMNSLLVKNNSQHFQTLIELASSLYKQGKVEEFIQQLGLDIESNKKDIQYYKQLVKNLKDQGLIEEAIACLDYGIQNNQTLEKFKLKKAKNLIYKEQYEQAKKNINQVL